MAGLYIHIPFCHSKCVYCDFYSTPRRERVEAVVAALIVEFNVRRSEVSSPFNTIYIGGGTPSVLPPESLLKLVGSLPIADVAEFTIEVNPEDVTSEVVELWKSVGINRVSMGVQSLNDTSLRLMRRRHTAAEALKAVATIREGGISNISADLIYGLPGESTDHWKQSLEGVLAAGVTHLSAYCLTYHEGTALMTMLRKGKITPADDATIESQFDLLRRITADHGFEHYEISNFAKRGSRSKHNSSYWNPRSQWLGIGPSAHSFDGRTRRIDHPDIGRWLDALPKPFVIDEESELDMVNDNIVTALRTVEGLDLSTIPENLRAGLVADAMPFVEAGEMIFSAEEPGRLAILPDRWLVSDSYIRELIRI